MPTKIDLGIGWKEVLQFLDSFRYIWWMFVPPVAAAVYRLLRDAHERRQDARAGLPEIDKMNGRRFEEWLANFFRARGYDVKLTSATGDYGVDLVITKDRRSTAVQAKRWKGRVGPGAIQEAFAGKAHYKANEALVVTNSHFTPAARQLAKSTGVLLWDRRRLKDEILTNQKLAASASPKTTAPSVERRR